MLRMTKTKTIAGVYIHSFIKESNNMNKKKGNIILPRGYCGTG